jgi:hypothetical protein
VIYENPQISPYSFASPLFNGFAFIVPIHAYKKTISQKPKEFPYNTIHNSKMVRTLCPSNLIKCHKPHMNFNANAKNPNPKGLAIDELSG